MMNIVIPMAGRGQRFIDAGYKESKPLIDVCGKPMIDRALESLRGDIIFIVLKRILTNKLKKYLLTKGRIIPISKITQGAPCTVLKGKSFVNNDDELIIANCDQYLQFDFRKFIKEARKSDGCILTFNSTNPHHSYARIARGKVVEVAEKKVISDNATAGLYYFKKGSDFVKGAKQMIEKGIRTNGEFYVCPVYNELIGMGKKITAWEIGVHKKHMLGTPQELQIFKDKVKNGEIKL